LRINFLFIMDGIRRRFLFELQKLALKW